MGGLGSGRFYSWDNKATTEDYRKIDIRKWHRNKLLKTNNVFACRWLQHGNFSHEVYVIIMHGKVVIAYISEGGAVKHDYSIRLSWTPCNYGGHRPWFICPAVGCNRRVAVLYGGKIFACRKCYRLAYRSQSESLCDRATRRADKIRERLDWEPGILNGNDLKPKGMHWKTFKRFSRQHNYLVGFALRVMKARFGGYSLLDDIKWYISEVDPRSS